MQVDAVVHAGDLFDSRNNICRKPDDPQDAALPSDENSGWENTVPACPSFASVTAFLAYGEAIFAVVVEHDWERTVAKRLDAPYRAGRQPTWRKVKNQGYSRREALVWRE
jgi:hypothetical protein